MNLKLKGLLSIFAVSAAFAAEPMATAEPVVSNDPAVVTATESVPVAESASAVEAPAPEASVEVAAPAVETAAQAEPAAPAVDPSAPAEEDFAPQVVRNGEPGPKAEEPKAEPSVPAVAVEEPEVVAPTAVRQVYYERVHVGPDGIPVRTIYVAQAPQKDTTSLDYLMGLVPMTFKIGAQAMVGSYYMSDSDNSWDGASFDGLAWRAGISAIIPLNQYTMGIKLGVLYEQSYASENYYIEKVPTSFRFEQKKLDIPVLFTFKASNSSFFFDLGAQISIPLQDELEVSFTDSETSKKIKSRLDLIDNDYRNPIDWSLVFGFSVMANKYVSLDVRADVGLSNIYEGTLDYIGLNLDASTFGIGVTVYPF